MKHLALALLIWCGAWLAAEDFTVEKDVSFLAEDRAEKLDLYLPQSNGALRPAVVMIHGGSWKHGSKSASRELNICTNLAKAGYVAVSIEYRLAKGRFAYPVNLNDCRDAVRFLRANAAKYQIDPARIGVIGASAGGHLALLLALTDEENFTDPSSIYPGVSCRVSCCINLYGVTTRFPEETQLNRDFDAMAGKSADAASLQEMLPVKRVKKSAPPVLTLHGTADKTVSFRHAEALDAALKSQGVPSELLPVAGVGHMFNMEFTDDGKPLPGEVKTAMLRFLENNLKVR